MATNSTANTTGLPRRIPKLAVRNRAPEDELASQPSMESRQTISRSSEATDQIESAQDSPLPWSSSMVEGMSGLRVCETQQSRQSADEDVGSDMSAARSKNLSTRKKNGGVLGFLTLKEPSTKAWEEFAEAEREKAKQGGKISSSQKLPNHVPKVNSKWDGMPDSARSKTVECKGGEKSKRSSISSAKPGWSDETHSSMRTEGYSTQPDSRISSDNPNASLLVPSAQRLAQPHLEPLPELSPFPSALDLGPRDAEKLDKSSTPLESIVGETPTTRTADMSDISPTACSVDSSDSRERPKPINFSRPLPKTPKV